VAKPNGLSPLVMTLEKRPSSHSTLALIGRIYPRSGKSDEGSQIAIPVPTDQWWQGMAGLGQLEVDAGTSADSGRIGTDRGTVRTTMIARSPGATLRGALPTGGH
jgi:hypothetical protein